MEEDDKGCPMIRMGVSGCFFLNQPTRVVPDQRPLNCCVCVCMCLYFSLLAGLQNFGCCLDDQKCPLLHLAPTWLWHWIWQCIYYSHSLIVLIQPVELYTLSGVEFAMKQSELFTLLLWIYNIFMVVLLGQCFWSVWCIFLWLCSD